MCHAHSVDGPGTTDRLPRPYWQDHDATIDCYWKAWKLPFGNLGDRDRFEKVFPVLVAYHQWMRDHRTFGWAGLAPITVLFEYVFGLRPDAANNRLHWDLRCLEAHGIDGYPFGATGQLDLRCAPRHRAEDEPQIEVVSDVEVTLDLTWPGGRKQVDVTPNR